MTGEEWVRAAARSPVPDSADGTWSWWVGSSDPWWSLADEVPADLLARMRPAADLLSGDLDFTDSPIGVKFASRERALAVLAAAFDDLPAPRRAALEADAPHALVDLMTAASDAW